MLLARLLRAATSRVSPSSPELLSPCGTVRMRAISTLRSTKTPGNGRSTETSDDRTLGNRLLRLVYPKRSAVIAIRKWIEEGRSIQKYQLNRIVRELRKHKRFKHALEICEWMRSQASIKLLPGDYAVHLDLIGKVRGLPSAEKFFEDLPLTMKEQFTCTALLHLYAQYKLSAKAESLFKEMSSHGFLKSSPLPYNHLITLYISTGELEKVPEVIEELKRNASPDEFTYNLWLTACLDKVDVKGAEEAMLDMAKHNVTTDHVTFSILTSLYIKAGKPVKAREALEKMERRVSKKDRAAFSHLISMYTSLSDIASAQRIWSKMKLIFRKLCDEEYKCMLISLLKFDLVDEAERIYKEWESVSGTKDSRILNVLVAHYAKNDMDKAEKFYEHAISSGVKPCYVLWESLALGYLQFNRMEKALHCLKGAFSSVKKWEPNDQLVRKVFGGLEKAGDTERAEEFLVMLRDAGYVTTEIYNSMLHVYAKSQKMPLIIGERMRKDGVGLDEETKRLLKLTSKFCVGSTPSLLL